MKYAFVLLLIFGAAILLAAASLLFSKDPRKSVFFGRVQGEMSKAEAQKTARTMAVCLAGVGTALVVYCVIGLLRGI